MNNITPMDKRYAELALRVLTSPRNLDWHDDSRQLLDSGPDYGLPVGREPIDVLEIAGRILGYYAGLIEWQPDDK